MLRKKYPLFKKIINKAVLELKLFAEFLIYASFMCIFSIMAFGMRHPTVFYLSEMISTPFIETEFNTAYEVTLTFNEIVTSDDFWAFAETIMLDGIWSKKWYDNTSYVSASDKNDWMILNENCLIGKPRLRQVRVRNDTCLVHEIFSDDYRKCYGEYTPENESKDPYGPGVGPQWTYNENCLGGFAYRGNLATYECGGYTQTLEKNKSLNEQLIKNLKNNIWIDRGTRVIFLDMTIYNININHFCIIKLIFEFPQSGGIIPSYSHKSFYYISKIKPCEVFITTTQYIFIIYIIIFSFLQCYDLITNFKNHIRTWWNYIEWLIIIVN